MSAVPNVINDGNWNLLSHMEESFAFPFSDKGDHSTFEAKLKYRQDKAAYRPRAPMTRIDFTLGSAYLVKLGDPRDISNGLFEWEDTFSSVPVTRTEYTSIPYTAQWFAAIGESEPLVNGHKYFYDVNYDIEEQTFTLSGLVVYEYFANTVPAPLLKPRVFLLYGKLQVIGGAPVVGNLLVAEDSQVGIYMGRIFERRTIYVRLNPPQAY